MLFYKLPKSVHFECVHARTLFLSARANNFKFKILIWFYFERYITRTVFSCFLSTDEEAAASKRMEFTTPFRAKGVNRVRARSQYELGTSAPRV